MKPLGAQSGKYGFGEIGIRMNKGYRIRSIGQELSCGSAQKKVRAIIPAGNSVIARRSKCAFGELPI